MIVVMCAGPKAPPPTEPRACFYVCVGNSRQCIVGDKSRNGGGVNGA